MTALLESALEYATHGISVVPLHDPTTGRCSCAKGSGCASSGKHPRLDWKPYQERRADPDEIRDWFDRWPTANVGIVTGRISRLCVLDVDPRNGGLETLVDLDHHGGQMPDDNPLAITGSEGLHHYYGLDAALPKAAPFVGIDVQADGALVVAPPSLHASGRRYRWARPITSPWPVVPAWLRWAVEQVEHQAPAVPVTPLPDAGHDDVLATLRAAGLYVGRHRRAGLHRIRCPWAELHSNKDPEAVVIEPGVSLAPGWGFKCLHGHCLEHGIGDLLSFLRIPKRRAA